MYLVHFLTFVFLLGVIRNSSEYPGLTEGQHGSIDPPPNDVGQEGKEPATANVTANFSPFVQDVLDKFWKSDIEKFQELPARPLVLDMLRHLVQEPTFCLVPNTNVVPENSKDLSVENGTVLTENGPKISGTNSTTSVSETPETQIPGDEVLKAGNQETQNKRTAALATERRTPECILQDLAETVRLQEDQTHFDSTKIQALVDELLQHEDILPDVETLTIESYLEALAEFYNTIGDGCLPELHSRLGFSISNKDFSCLAADMIMTSPQSFDNNAIMYVIGLKWKDMNLQKVTGHLNENAKSKVAQLALMCENSIRGLPVHDTPNEKVSFVFAEAGILETVKEFTALQQYNLDNGPGRNTPKTREDALKKAQLIINNQDANVTPHTAADETNKLATLTNKPPEGTNKPPMVTNKEAGGQEKLTQPLKFSDVVLGLNKKVKTFTNDFQEFIDALEQLVIPKEEKMLTVIPNTNDNQKLPFDVIFLLDGEASYSNKSAIAQIRMRRLPISEQKIVFGKFFGRKLSALITKLTQIQRIDLLKKYLKSVSLDKKLTLKCVREILLRFPHLLKPEVAEAAASHRIPHWNGDKIVSFFCKLRERKTQEKTEGNAKRKEIADKLKAILKGQFFGIYGEMVNTILDSASDETLSSHLNKSVHGTMEKESHGKFVLFFGIKSILSQFHPCQFQGMPMFGTREENGVTFPCAEKWMMLIKALLFNDLEVAGLIKKMISLKIAPVEFKNLGRVVNNFNHKNWNLLAKEIIYQGNALKFAEGGPLYEDFRKALGLGERFVEGNKGDQIYGIGLDKDDPRAKDKASWRGDNLLGQALTDLWLDMFQQTVSETDQSNKEPSGPRYPRYIDDATFTYFKCNLGPLTVTKVNT